MIPFILCFDRGLHIIKSFIYAIHQCINGNGQTFQYLYARQPSKTVEKLNESILRFVFNDFKNSYGKLLQEVN